MTSNRFQYLCRYAYMYFIFQIVIDCVYGHGVSSCFVEITWDDKSQIYHSITVYRDLPFGARIVMWNWFIAQ